MNRWMILLVWIALLVVGTAVMRLLPSQVGRFVSTTSYVVIGVVFVTVLIVKFWQARKRKQS